jgi:hypothetical protein
VTPRVSIAPCRPGASASAGGASTTKTARRARSGPLEPISGSSKGVRRAHRADALEPVRGGARVRCPPTKHPHPRTSWGNRHRRRGGMSRERVPWAR